MANSQLLWIGFCRNNHSFIYQSHNYSYSYTFLFLLIFIIQYHHFIVTRYLSWYHNFLLINIFCFRTKLRNILHNTKFLKSFLERIKQKEWKISKLFMNRFLCLRWMNVWRWTKDELRNKAANFPRIISVFLSHVVDDWWVIYDIDSHWLNEPTYFELSVFSQDFDNVLG